MKPHSDALRQDVLRGLRWGAIMAIALLLGIAAYRIFGSSPAVASEPAPVAQPLPLAAEPAPAVEVGPVAEQAPPETVLAAPEPARAPVPARRQAATPIPQPQTFSAPKSTFVPAPAALPPSPASTEVDVALPQVENPPVAATPLPGPDASTELAPPPVVEDKQGRPGRLVRGVGRILGFGRRETQEKQK